MPIEARREVPAILVSIGTPAAARVLLENLLERDTTLRFRIISSLNKVHHLHPEIEPDIQMLETVVAAEILGHYRSYQILHTLGATRESQDPVARALMESMQQELERIFRLLGLLYPHLDLHAAYLGLQSKNVSVYDNALEFLDNVLKSQLRDMLVPLLDYGGGAGPHSRPGCAFQDRKPGAGSGGTGRQRRSLAKVLRRIRDWNVGNKVPRR